MKESTQTMRWNSEEVEVLRQFVSTKRKPLLEYFYKNIFLGELKVRKPRKFFVEMSRAVGRTAEQCKSKFQKFEKKVFKDFLKVPVEHFEVFQWLRDMRCQWRRWEKAKKKTGGLIAVPEVEGKDFRRLEKVRDGIIEGIMRPPSLSFYLLLFFVFWSLFVGFF